MAEQFKVTATASLNETKSRAQIQKSLNNISKSLNVNIGALKDVKTTLNQVGNEAKGVEKSTLTFKDAMGKTSSVVSQTNTNLKNTNKTIGQVKTNTDLATKSSMSFFDMMQEGAEKMIIWTIVGGLIFGTKRAIEDAVVAVKELDDALLELNKVVDLTDQEVSDFVVTATNLGESLNATTAEVATATSMFAKMGFELGEAMELAEKSLVLTKVGDNMGTVEDSASALISVLKGFNLEATEAGRIIDIINKVSNEFAVSSSDITMGMSRVSAVLAQSNTSLEESVALFTSVFEILQNSEMSASGLVTISSRLLRIKDDVEDVNGLTTNLGEAFKEYAGIDLEKANGELKSTYEIITETAEVWDTLDQKAQGYIAFLASGTRQAKTWNSLMSNSESILNATSAGLNSNNSAMDEFTKYLDSMQGKLDQLNATWNRIALDFVDSDFVDSMLDFANSTSEVVENLGVLNTVLLATAGILGASGKLGFALKGITTIFAQYVFGATASTTATIALSTALSTLAPVAVIGGIIALVKGIDALIVTQEEWNEKITESSIKIEELKGNISALNSEIESGTSKNIKLLEKELELQEKALEVEQKRRAEMVDNLIPALEDINSQYSSMDARDVMSLGDADDTRNLVGAFKAINEELERVEKLAEKAIDTDEMEHYKSVITSLEEKQVDFSNSIISQIKTMESVPYNMLSEDARKYLLILREQIGLGDDTAKAYYELTNAFETTSESTEELEKANNKLVTSFKDLDDAMHEYLLTGEIADETASEIINDQEAIDFALQSTSDEIIAYGEQWGITAEEVVDIQQQILDAMVQGSRARLSVLLKEQQALNEYVSSDDFLLFGNPREVREQGTEIANSIEEILSSLEDFQIRDIELDDVFKESTKSTKKQTEEIDSLSMSVLEYQRILREIQILENQTATDGIDNSEKLTKLYKSIQEYAHARANELRAEKALLGDSAEDLYRINEIEQEISQWSDVWFDNQNKINELLPNITEELENQRDIMEDIDRLSSYTNLAEAQFKVSGSVEDLDNVISKLKSELEALENTQTEIQMSISADWTQDERLQAVEQINDIEIQILNTQAKINDYLEDRSKLLNETNKSWLGSTAIIDSMNESLDKQSSEVEILQLKIENLLAEQEASGVDNTEKIIENYEKINEVLGSQVDYVGKIREFLENAPDGVYTNEDSILLESKILELSTERLNIQAEINKLKGEEVDISEELKDVLSLSEQIETAKKRLALIDKENFEDRRAGIRTIQNLLREENNEIQSQLDKSEEIGLTLNEQEDLTQEILDNNKEIKDYDQEILNIDQEILDIEQEITDEKKAQKEAIDDIVADFVKKQKDGLEEQLDDTKDYWEDVIDEAKKANEQILEDTLDRQEQELEDAKDARLAQVESEYDKIKEIREEEDYRLKIAEAQQKVEEARLNVLEQTNERINKVFTGKAFEFMADTDAVANAQDQYESAQDNLADIELDRARDLEDDLYEQKIQAVKDGTDEELRITINALNQKHAEELRLLKNSQNNQILLLEKVRNEKISIVESELEAISNLIDQYTDAQIESLEDLKETIESMGGSLRDYEKTLKKVSETEKLMSQTSLTPETLLTDNGKLLIKKPEFMGENKLIQSMQIPQMIPNKSTTNNNNNVTQNISVSLPSVKNGNDFANELNRIANTYNTTRRA